MLRLSKSPPRDAEPAADPRPPAPINGIARPGGTEAAAELWPAYERFELADTVRRICTLVGWGTNTVQSGRTLAITSAVEREGKSTLARALAIAMANDHARDVLLMECDLLRPTLANDLDVSASPGVTDVVTSSIAFDAAYRATEIPNLYVLPAGAKSAKPSRLLRSPEMQELVAHARRRFSFIVLDLPAALKSSDVSVLAGLSDGVVFVVRAGSTSERAVQRGIGQLDGVTLHGVVLNRWKSGIPGPLRRLVQG